MDPISLTASVIAVLQITTACISICYSYRTSLTTSSQQIQQISSSLNSLKDVLESLLTLIETSKPGELSTVESLARDGGALQECLGELERLKGKLEIKEGWRGVGQRVAWPLKEGEVRRQLEGLERWKGTLGLALSADQA